MKMKIKSIDTFSLTECQEYLKEAPNGEYDQKVADSMRDLQQEMKQDSDIAEFNTKFNRLYTTQRYEEAFALCFQNLHNVKDKEKIVEKANLAISKLRNHIQIPSSIPISYDWLIDSLVSEGYKKMKYDGKSLKLKTIIVKISNKGNTTEIAIKCRIKLFFLIVIIICLTVALWAIPYFCIYKDDVTLVATVVAVFFFFITILLVIIYPEKEERRTIKKILIEYLSK